MVLDPLGVMGILLLYCIRIVLKLAEGRVVHLELLANHVLFEIRLIWKIFLVLYRLKLFNWLLHAGSLLAWVLYLNRREVSWVHVAILLFEIKILSILLVPRCVASAIDGWRSNWLESAVFEFGGFKRLSELGNFGLSFQVPKSVFLISCRVLQSPSGCAIERICLLWLLPLTSSLALLPF